MFYSTNTVKATVGAGAEPPGWRVMVEEQGAREEPKGGPVETQALRLEVKLAPRRGAGLFKWRVM